MYTIQDINVNKLVKDAELNKIKTVKIKFSYFLNQQNTKICYLFHYVKNKDEFIHQLTIEGLKEGDEFYINVLLKYYSIALIKLIKEDRIHFDFMCRVLSHDEIIANGSKPLDLFCKKISKKFKIKYEDKFILKRKVNTKFTSLKRRDDRIKEMTNNYYCNKKFKLLPKSTILIVDDVITSGTSANEIIRAIRSSYPKFTIYFISITKTVNNYNANDVFFDNVEYIY